MTNEMQNEAASRASGGAKILVLPTADLAGADDAALVEAIRRGEPQASRALWLRYSRLVHRIIRRSLGQPADVEDLAQEVFLNLFRRLPTLREPRALPAFILTITTLTLRHELRRRWVRRYITLGATEDIGADQQVVHPDPEARQAVSRFYAILDKLKPEERMAFVLRFIEGMELTEIASALELSLATVKRRLAKARSRLEHHIAKDAALASYLLVLDGETP